MNQAVSIPSAEKVNLLDFDRQGLRDFFAQLGEKPYRAEQVMKWIYHRLEDNFENMRRRVAVCSSQPSKR